MFEKLSKFINWPKIQIKFKQLTVLIVLVALLIATVQFIGGSQEEDPIFKYFDSLENESVVEIQSPTAGSTVPSDTVVELFTTKLDIVPGNTITFGQYEQDNNRSNGAEPINWIVLDIKEDGRALVISKMVLDSQPYHSTLETVTWETSSLRKWLNHDFIKKAFSEEEQIQILAVKNENPDHSLAKTSSGKDTDDQVFILTMEEAKELFSSYSSRQAKPTAYAIAHGAYVNPDNKMTWWWLRTTSYLTDHVTFVASGGDVSDEGREVTRQDAGVRPVMWIDVVKAQPSE